MKQKLKGFTLIELLVVISIMGVLAGVIIANYAGQRSGRDLRIAANQLVTNIRKAQSYSLSSRTLNGTTPVQYYILRFDTATNTQYYIQGMYNVKTTPPRLQNAETINLPTGITVSNVDIIANGTQLSPSPSCVLIAFQLPYARILNNSGCAGNPPIVNSNDDYQKFINFITNNAGTTVTSDSLVVITLQGKSGTSKVLINGTTGVVCPTAGIISGTPPTATCLTRY